MISIDELKAELEEIANHPRGSLGRLEDLERSLGCEIIPWGDTSLIPYSKEDWHEGLITKSSLPYNTIRIILIYAIRPGRGAFRKLVQAIIDKGYTPVVVSPFPNMAAILTRWGWTKKMVGTGAMSHDEWSPSKPTV